MLRRLCEVVLVLLLCRVLPSTPCMAQGQQDLDWLNWIVVNTQPATLAHGEALTDREKLDFIKDFDPDMFDWWSGALMNRAYIATMRGIAADSSIEYEYESALHGVKYFEDEIYGGNGPGITEKGQRPRNYYGDFDMTHLAPKWHETVKNGIMRLALYGDMVCHDNLIHGLHYQYAHFDDWSNRRFVAYMQERFPDDALRQLEFNPRSFHIRSYVREQRDAGQTNAMLIEDPIIHEFTRFYYMSLIGAVAEFVDLVHQSPPNLTAPTGFYGNLGSMTQMRTPGLAYSEYVDMVWIERLKSDQPCLMEDPNEKQARSSLMYKIAKAAGHFEKTVCTYQNPPLLDSRRLSGAIEAAEAYANGGLLVLTSHFKKKGGYNGALYKAHAHHARFANAHREAFIDRRRVADVAVINSIPTLFWRWFSSFDVDRPHLKQIEAVARLLEDHHVSYDALIFGHPDIYNDADHLERLQDYQTVVLPNVDAISDRQVAAVVQWVRAGGKLILWGENGTRDEELRPRSGNAFAALIQDPGQGRVVSTSSLGPLTHPENGLSLDITEAYVNHVKEAEERLAAVFEQERPLLEVDLPPTVWVNVWRHGGGPMITVQLVNYAIDLEADSVDPVKDFKVRVRVPAGAAFAKATWSHTDYLAEDFRTLPPVQELPMVVKDGYAEVTVPHLGVLGVLSLTAAGEGEARATAAQVRKWYQRLKIARRAPGQADASEPGLAAEAESYLAGIQGDVQVKDFAGLIEPGNRLATRLQANVARISVQVPAARTERLAATLAAEAVHKFDFGANAEAPAGWLPVGLDTDYSAERGYGWVAKGPLTVVGGAVSLDAAVHLPFDDLSTLDTKECSATSGVFGKAVMLATPQSRVRLEDQKELNPGSESFTVSGWIRTDPTAHTGSQLFVSKGNRSNRESGWSILEANGRLIVRVNGQSPPLWACTPSAFLEPNRWYHVALVVDRDRDVLTGYVDGSRMSGTGAKPTSTIPDRAVFSSHDPLIIGAAGDKLFSPGIAADDFRIWNAALGAAEIEKLYLEGHMLLAKHAEAATAVYPELDAMHADYIRSKNPIDYIEKTTGNRYYPVVLPPANEAEFRVDLPNGDYIVTAVIGSPDESYNAFRVGVTYIDAEGLPVVYGERLNSGVYQNRVFPVRVGDGHLDLRLRGRNVGPLYQNNCDWMINGLLVQQAGRPLTPQAARSLAQTRQQSVTAIRDWRVIGPFEDPDWLGFERHFGPEGAVDPAVTYRTDGGRVLAWRRIGRLQGHAPYVSFNDMLAGTATKGACAFAMAEVRCRRETDASLSVSTSQFGEVYLNGSKVLTDNLPAGLLGDEYRVPVKLGKGANVIVIKTLNHWGDEWAVRASLADRDGRPLQ